MDWYQMSAKAGNSHAMNNKGWICEKGLGVSIDYPKAMEWYKKSAAAGYEVAIFNLGCIYEDGVGIPIDYQKAMELYQKALVPAMPMPRVILATCMKMAKALKQTTRKR
jgi:uncharacterized protein